MNSFRYVLLALATLLAACSSSQNNAKNTPDDAQVIQTAENMKRSGNAAGAVAVLRQAQGTHPDDPLILSQLGNMLISAGQPQEAVGVFDHLIALQPANASAYNGKAVALDRTGSHAAAQELYEQALKLSPESVSIQNNLAMSMILNDQIDQAIALLEQLNRVSSSNQTVRQNLALAYGIKGDKKKALALNLQDLPEDQAQENLRFYDQYVSEHKKTSAQDDQKKKKIADKSHTPANGKTAMPVAQAKTVPPVSVTPETHAASQDKPEASIDAAPVANKEPDTDKTVASSSAAAPETPAVSAESKPDDSVHKDMLPSLSSVFNFVTPPSPSPTYPTAGKQAGTVLPTAENVSSTPASLKGMAPPAVATLELPATAAKDTPTEKLEDLAPAAGGADTPKAASANDNEDSEEDTNAGEPVYPSLGKR